MYDPEVKVRCVKCGAGYRDQEELDTYHTCKHDKACEECDAILINGKCPNGCCDT